MTSRERILASLNHTQPDRVPVDFGATVVSGIGWVKAWATVDGYFWNSIKITVPAVLISTAIGALNGYVLSFWRFRGSQLFFGLLLEEIAAQGKNKEAEIMEV